MTKLNYVSSGLIVSKHIFPSKKVIKSTKLTRAKKSFTATAIKWPKITVEN